MFTTLVTRLVVAFATAIVALVIAFVLFVGSLALSDCPEVGGDPECHRGWREGAATVLAVVAIGTACSAPLILLGLPIVAELRSRRTEPPESA